MTCEEKNTMNLENINLIFNNNFLNSTKKMRKTELKLDNCTKANDVNLIYEMQPESLYILNYLMLVPFTMNRPYVCNINAQQNNPI